MKLSKKLHLSALVLLNFLLLHYVVSSIPLQWDLTDGNTYTLSDSSKALVSKIEEPIQMDFYYSKTLKDQRVGIKNIANRIEQLLKQYEKASGGKIVLNTINPTPDSPEEESAIASGMQGVPINPGDNLYLGLVAIQADQEKTIPFFNFERLRFLEYDISKLIYEAQSLKRPTLGLISSLPLIAPAYPQMPGQPPQQDQYIVENLRSVFDLENVDPTAESLPSGVDALAVIHPQNLSPSLEYEIDQHVLSGKPLFLAVDPSSAYFRNQSQQMGMMRGQPNPNTSSSFNRFFDAWKVDYNPGQVTLDAELAVTQPGRVMPSWLLMNNESMNEEFLPASDLNALHIIEPGSLSLSDDSTLSLTPALRTSTQTSEMDTMMLSYMQPDQLLQQMEPSGESKIVAGLLSGEFQTAFPEGKPSSDDEAESVGSHLTTGEGNVFVIADSDWLLDSFSVRRLDFFGTPAAQPLNDNQSLAANTFEYLSGSEDLIGIRGKGTAVRNFDVVQQMEVEAQQAYQAKLQEMEGQRAEIQQRVQEIVSQQQGSGLIVASPELQESLQEFRDQEAQLAKAIREIRRNMRSNIDNLGRLLGAINLLYAPIALAIFGLLFFRARKQPKF